MANYLVDRKQGSKSGAAFLGSAPVVGTSLCSKSWHYRNRMSVGVAHC